MFDDLKDEILSKYTAEELEEMETIEVGDPYDWKISDTAYTTLDSGQSINIEYQVGLCRVTEDIAIIVKLNGVWYCITD